MDWSGLLWFAGIIALVSLATAWLMSGRLKAWLTGRRAMPDEQESPVVHPDPED